MDYKLACEVLVIEDDAPVPYKVCLVRGNSAADFDDTWLVDFKMIPIPTGATPRASVMTMIPTVAYLASDGLRDESTFWAQADRQRVQIRNKVLQITFALLPNNQAASFAWDEVRNQLVIGDNDDRASMLRAAAEAFRFVYDELKRRD